MGWHGAYKPRKFEVGEQLLALRTRAKLTQAQLAVLVGASRRTIQSWEAGEAYPQEDKLRQLITVFLAKGVLTPGQEYEEGFSLWQQVSQDAGRYLAQFEEIWFATLLANHRVHNDHARSAPFGTVLPVATVSRSAKGDLADAVPTPEVLTLPISNPMHFSQDRDLPA